MTEPSDTDRIIAAQREEARKTRALLITIFVGLPAAGLLAWVVIAAASHHGTSSGTGTDTTAVCPSVAPTEPGATLDVSACPLSGPALTDASSCADFNAADAVATPTGQTSPAEAYLWQAKVSDFVAFETRCAEHPTDTLGTVLAYVEALPAH